MADCHYTADELEVQYQCSQWNRRGPSAQKISSEDVMKEFYENLVLKSEQIRSAYPSQLGIVYGSTERQICDIFTAPGCSTDAPILVYIHGGYWQEGQPSDYSGIVKPFLEAKTVVVILGYDLCPQVTVGEIVEEIKIGIGYILHMAHRNGSRGVYIAGHSAGAHLTAMLLTIDWKAEFLQTSSLIKGAVLLSGVFDLRPLVLTSIGRGAKLTEADATAWSPLSNKELKEMIYKQLSKCNKTFSALFALGEYESDEFHRQSKEFAQFLRTTNIDVTELIVKGCDHLNLIENIAVKEDYELTHAIMKLMEIKRGSC